VNPDTVVVRRLAGLRSRRTAGGLVTGTRLTDDPIAVTGGGRTEIELDLLFDVSLVRTPNPPSTVRDLTQPLWQLAENGPEGDYPTARNVRLVWGKSWNIPVVVAAVSERFERFTVTGVPERSWVRLRLIRTGEPETFDLAPGLSGEDQLDAASIGIEEVPEDQITFHEILGGDDKETERLDEIATRYYGEPALWRILARFNDVEDPLDLDPQSIIRVPPVSAVRSAP
jgi:contractile injection system tube protein